MPLKSATELVQPEVLTPDTIAGFRVTAPAAEGYINMLVYGESGAGKTRLAGSACAVPEMSPVLLIDFEGGTLSLASDYSDVQVIRVTSWGAVDRLYGALYDKNPYKTIVMDSLSEIQKFCYDNQTEILTQGGWKLFKDLTDEDLVAQYEVTTEEINFVPPLARQQFEHNGEMVSICNKSFDVLVTPNHRMLTQRQSGIIRVLQAKDIKPIVKMPTAGLALTSNAQSPTPDQARVLLAWVADGHGHKEIYTRGRQFQWGFKKPDKRDRLCKLLQATGTPYHVRTAAHDTGWTWLVVEHEDGAWIEKYLPMREWNEAILGWDHETRSALLDELQFWDGRAEAANRRIWNTTNKSNADLIQAVGVITGWSATVVKDEGTPGGNIRVNLIRDRGWRSVSPDSIGRQQYEGTVYCVTVPSGFVVVRRNGRAYVCGNSMAQIMKAVIQKDSERDPEVPSIREWGKNSEQIRRLVRALRDLPCNTIFTALANEDHDDRTNTDRFRPLLPGKLKSEVSGYVDIVGYLYRKEFGPAANREVKTLMLTQGTERHAAKDRTGCLPSIMEEPTMRDIFMAMNGRKVA
jgi:hypothetical protein